MALKKKDIESKEKEKDNKKLTGRELFMCDKTLNDSDLTFDEGNCFNIAKNKALQKLMDIRIHIF